MLAHFSDLLILCDIHAF